MCTKSSRGGVQVPHEASWDMGTALAILAFGSIFVGALSALYFESLTHIMAQRGSAITALFSTGHYGMAMWGGSVVDVMFNPGLYTPSTVKGFAGLSPYLHMLLPYYTQSTVVSGVSLMVSGLGLLG